MTKTRKTTPTREQWLQDAAKVLRQRIRQTSGVKVPQVNISVGFPGGRGDKTGVIGQCWNKAVIKNGRPTIFISPVLDDKVRILDVLLHEMVHAAHPMAGHGAEFKATAVAAGLEGKMTATVASKALRRDLKALAKDLGPWTNGSVKVGGAPVTKTNPKTGKTVTLTPWGSPKQSTRMLKVVCPEDGYTVRTSAKWLAVGFPSCPCGTTMVEG